MLYSTDNPLHNVIPSLPHLSIPLYKPEPTTHSPLNEISDLVNFTSHTMSNSNTGNPEQLYHQSDNMFTYRPEDLVVWGDAESHISGYAVVTTVDQLLQTDQDNVFQPLYSIPPVPVAHFQTPSLNTYSPSHSSHYSPPSVVIPPTPSTTYSPQPYLSPWQINGNISSTPTTPLTIPPMLSAHSEPVASPRPAQGLSYQEQITSWKRARELPAAMGNPEFIPQKMYRPHTSSDIKRYIEEVALDLPIIFWMEGPDECGIPLTDALHSRTKRLRDHDMEVFEGRGPSVSIRLEWPGYRQWSRQIPTKDFKSPPRPINMTKLCKNVAKCVQRFINERQHCELEDGADSRWRVGDGPRHRGLKLEDLVLVSLHHVSMGSWQPQLRLRPRLRP